MNVLAEEYHHKAEIRGDDEIGDTVFKWHFPAHTFDPRMSALELAVFLLPHMPSVLPLLFHHPQVWLEFKILMDRLVLWPTQVLDEIVPWIKSIVRTEENDIIELNLRAKKVQVGPTYVLLGDD